MIEKGEEPRSSAVKMKIRAKKQTAKEKNGGISMKIKGLRRGVEALLKQKFVKNVVQDLTSGGEDCFPKYTKQFLIHYYDTNEIFQRRESDEENRIMMNTVGEAGDVMHLSQNVVEAFIDRIEVFNDERVKIHFTFEDVLADHAE